MFLNLQIISDILLDMNAIKIGDEIIKSLNEWSKNNRKLVVGIDGIPGVGKTTIADYIGNNNLSVLVIHIDDFMTPVEFRRAEIEKLNDFQQKIDFFTFNWFEYQDIKDIIKKFREGNQSIYKTKLYRNGERQEPAEFDLTKQILLFEGILLYHPDLLNSLWDKRIIIDGEEQIIKQRRMQRERERWSDKYISEDEDPNSWYKFILEGIKQYRSKYKPEEKADLVFINHLN